MMESSIRAEPQTIDVLRDDLSHAEWDAALAALGGHPLQSTLWGEAKRISGKARAPDTRFALYDAGRPVWMARIEERRVPVLGRIAWVPKGPTVLDPACAIGPLPAAVRLNLAAQGFDLVVTNPNVRLLSEMTPAGSRIGGEIRSIWVDLSKGRDAAFAGLDPQFRQALRRAAKEGVTVTQSRCADDVEAFTRLCHAVSRLKRFALDLDRAQVAHLLERDSPTTPARLFLAKYSGRVVAGALCLGVGRSWHYFFGGVERETSHMRTGEAVNWAVIEAAIEAGAARYDAEGIDDVGNPGTARFKRKLGGEEIAFPGHLGYPLTTRGRALALALAIRESRNLSPLLAFK